MRTFQQQWKPWTLNVSCYTGQWQSPLRASYLSDRSICLQEVGLQEGVKQVSCDAFNGVVNGQQVHFRAILHIWSLQILTLTAEAWQCCKLRCKSCVQILHTLFLAEWECWIGMFLAESLEWFLRKRECHRRIAMHEYNCERKCTTFDANINSFYAYLVNWHYITKPNS